MNRHAVIRWTGSPPEDVARLRNLVFDPHDFAPALRTTFLILQPTSFCNISCDYCYLPNRNSSARMTAATVRTAAERLRDDGLLSSELTVVWHAGEPLVVPPAWYEDAFAQISDVVGASCRVSHSIQTNGTLIDDAWCDLFIRHGVQVGISIDGPADLHDAHRRTRQGKGTHAQVMRGMATLRAREIVFHAIAVVTPETFKEAERFIDFFEENPVSELGCNVDEAEGVHATSSLVGQEGAHAAFLAQLLERSRRPESRFRVRELTNALHLIAEQLPTVRWRGRVWPLNPQTLPFAMVNVAHDGRWSTFSPELLGQRAPAYEDFLFGNVHEAGYMAGARTEAFQRAWGAIFQGVEVCEQQCAYFSYCGGGAPANKFYENGTLDSGETLYCRSVMKRPFETVLVRLERDRNASLTPRHETEPR